MAAERVAVRDYPYGKAAAHVVGWTGKVTQAELDGIEADQRDLAAAKPYTVNDEIGKAGIEKDLRGRPAGDPRPARPRGRRRGQPRPGHRRAPAAARRRRRPQPRHQPAGHRRTGAQDGARPGVEAPRRRVRRAQRRSGRVHRRARPQQRRRAGHGLGPDLRAGRLRRRRQPQRVGLPPGRREPPPAQQLGPPGPVRARARRSSPSPRWPASTPVSSRPNTTINDQGVYTIPNCKDERCDRFNDQRKKYGTGRPAALAHRVVGRLLLRPGRTVLDPAGRCRRSGGVPGAARAVGLLRQDGHRPARASSGGASRRRSGRRSTASRSTVRRGRRAVVHRRQRQHGHRPGRCARDPAPAGLGLRHPRQRRHPLEAAAGQGGAGRPHPRGEALVRAGGARHASTWPRSGAKRSSRASSASPPRRAAPPPGAFAGFPSDTFPVAAKTGTAQVRGKAPTAVFGSFAPAYEPRYAISVLLEESGYGGRAAAPVARRLFDVLISPDPLPDAKLTAQAPPADAPAAPIPGTCATDGRHLHAHGEPWLPGALGRMSRNPASAWRHVDLVLVGCVVAVSALGCLMIFSSTRGHRSERLQHRLPVEAAAVHGGRRRGHGDRGRRRLPALPRAGPARVRRRAAHARCS